MNIVCPKCGESWDFDMLHDYAAQHNSTYKIVAKMFRTEGCAVAFKEWRIDNCEADENSSIRFGLADFLGDDIDGYASEIEYLNL